MSNTKPTVADVAKKAGVSKTTVSYYLNHKYESMSKETIQRIEDVVNELGYKCNNNYHRRKKTMQIGLVVTDLTDPFIANLCKGINDAITKHGYNLLIANTDNNPSSEKNYIKNFINKTDGLIIYTCGMDDETLQLLSNSVPVVLVDRVIENNVFDVVTSNNYDAMTELVKYLYDMEYTAFGLFTESLVSGSARNVRCKAFNDFASKYQGHSFFHIYPSSLFDENLLMSQIKVFLEKTVDKKRVFIGVNGRTTLMVISALTNLNLKIPDDVGVCGFDDFDWANILKGGVTTVQQPTYDIGYECVERLFKRMNKEKLPVKEIHLHSRLILRSSLK